MLLPKNKKGQKKPEPLAQTLSALFTRLPAIAAGEGGPSIFFTRHSLPACRDFLPAKAWQAGAGMGEGRSHIQTHLQFLLHFLHRILKHNICVHHILHRFAGINDGTVIAPAKLLADGFQ